MPNTTRPRDTTVVRPLTIDERIAWPPPPVGQLAVDPVPAADKPAKQPLTRLIMPLVMVVAMVAMVGFMVFSGRGINPMMMLFPLMMLASMGAMFGGSSGGDPDETRRTYLRHLQTVKTTALDNAAAQKAHAEWRFPAAADLWSMVSCDRLWERAAGDPDVGWVRVATGTVALDTPVTLSEAGAPEDVDPVCAVAANHMIAGVSSVPDSPIGITLTDFPVIRIDGDAAADLARSLVAQLVFHHGPELVGVSVAGNGFGWVKWLPHARGDAAGAAHRILLNCAPDGQVDAAGEQFDTVIDLASRPQSVLWHTAHDSGLMLTATTGQPGPARLLVTTTAGDEQLGLADVLSEAAAAVLARKITGLTRPAVTDRGPVSAGLLNMCGFAEPGRLQPETMWPPRQAADRLAVPVGLSDKGRPVVLDIKESAQGGVGPHGLCIGATGSGKSELLRTLVVALAATHSPDDVNFVLVDFKGGATFLGLDSLPHTSAVITNLAEEAVLVDRMHDAISGEMNRRQEMLREAGNYKNVDDYNKARREGKDLPPLPALVIILDEFSELLGQHPDFADLFTAVGRLGRSLHIHLLLASQRLEEGRLRGLDSHLSYRLGLKTFSAAESRQVLGVTDAYHLPARPGEGIFRSDADELTRFRASYVSGPMDPAEGSAERPPQLVHPILFTAADDIAAASVAPVESITTADGQPPVTTVDFVVAAACRAAAARGMRAHKIWLDPLPPAISLGQLIGDADTTGEGGLAATIGLVDRPAHQSQDVFAVTLDGAGGHMAVCGAPRTGTTTALVTTAVSLAVGHSSDRVRFYVIDLGGGTAASLRELPHTAGAARRGEDEKIHRIIDEVTGLIDHPDSRHTFLIIDGWHTVVSDYADSDITDSLGRIASDGLGANVHLLIGVQRWSLIRPNVRDLIGTRLELRLTEAMDSLVDRQAQKNIPPAPGRGLTPQGEHLLVALTGPEEISHAAARARARGDRPVAPLKMLPETITVDQLDAPAGTVVLGVGGAALQPVVFDPAQQDHLICFGSRGCGKSTLVATMAAGVTALGRQAARMVVLDPRRRHLGAFDQDMTAFYAATPDDCAAAVEKLAVTLKKRLPPADVTPQALKERSYWQGPEIWVLIDDHDLLPDGVLSPLVPLVPHARDIGLHVVLARKAGGAARALWDPFIGRIKDQTPVAVLMDCDREEGTLFGIRAGHQRRGRARLSIDGDNAGICHIAMPGR